MNGYSYLRCQATIGPSRNPVFTNKQQQHHERGSLIASSFSSKCTTLIKKYLSRLLQKNTKRNTPRRYINQKPKNSQKMVADMSYNTVCKFLLVILCLCALSKRDRESDLVCLLQLQFYAEFLILYSSQTHLLVACTSSFFLPLSPTQPMFWIHGN